MSPKYLLSLLICFHLCLLSSSQLTFPSSSIQLLDSGITFYFEYNTTNGSILMGLEMNQNVNYFAIGFAGKGNFEMQTFDIVAFVFSPSTAKSNATVKVLDMYSTQNAKPPTDVSLGGTSDYHLIDSYVADGKTQVLFERLMNTQDKYDYQFVPEITAEEVVINYAFNTGQPGLSYHGNNADTLSSPIYNGFNGVAKVYYPDFMNPHLAMAIHGWILLFGWGILIEITLQFGRYRKFSNVYLKVHLYTASFLYFLTAVASALAIYIKWGSKYKGLLHLSHFYMGLINLGLCTLQTIFGFVFRAIILKRNTTKLIPIFSQSHTISGILIYLINKILIGTGVALKWPQYMPYMYGYYAVLIVFRVAQEILFRVDRKIDGKSTLKIEGDDSQAEINRRLMELLNNNTPVSEILDNKEVKDVKWAILDDKVFSLEEITHPGGNFILEQINGREVGRFIYGSYGLESLTQSTQYLHSKAAILAVQNNLIGTIQNTQQILVAKAQQPQMESLNIEEAEITKKLIDPKATSVSEGFSSGLNEGNGDWVLTKKTDLTPLIAKFELRSDDYDINPLAKNIRHIGRHVKVSHCSQKKVRLYTLVLSQTESRTRRRQLLWDRQYKDSNINVNPASVSRSDTFPLILKKYNSPVSKTLSSIFHESQIGTEGFIIEGPFGTGLDLTPESTGVHVILAAGTGILPFIDLFDYLLEGVLDPSSGNNIFKNGFKLHLLASFNELGDFVGLDICEKLAKACADKGMKDAFKMVIKAEGAQSSELYSVTKEMFDNAFIEKNVDKECARVYVCGPPVFNQQLPLGLELIGVPKARIMMV